MPVTIETNGDTMVARLSGELDHHHTQKLREEIDRNVQKERPARLALDFSGVEFMDSSAIGSLITIRNRLLPAGGVLALCSIGEGVAKVLRITDLGKVFALHADLDSALAAHPA